MMDVHGAGAQRSDMKSGDPSNCPSGRVRRAMCKAFTTSPAVCAVGQPPTSQATWEMSRPVVGKLNLRRVVSQLREVNPKVGSLNKADSRRRKQSMPALV